MSLASQDRIEQLLARSRAGDRTATDEVTAALYAELHKIALSLVGNRPAGLTLQATALVHEAWLRLRLRRSEAEQLADRNHFLKLAARAMRCVLVDHARARKRRAALPRGGRPPVRALNQIVLAHEAHACDLEALDGVLERLAASDARMAQAVELRFFAGLDIKATAAALDMPLRTFEREWAAIRVWLLGQVQ